MFRAYRLRLVIVIAVFPYLAVFTSISHGGGIVVNHRIESPSIAKNKVGHSSNRIIDVYLPENYEKGNYRYPVIYWLPGWGMGGTALYPQKLDEAIQNMDMPPAIVVFVNASEGTFFLNSDAFGYWEDFLINEVIPFIDGQYRTIPDMSGRALMGHSAGGFAAVMLPLWYPDIWGAIGTNDAGIFVPWEYLLDKEEIEPFEQEFKDIILSWGINARKDLFDNIFKSDIENYNSADMYTKAVWQFAAKISPNPDKPSLVDLPMTEDGNWIPEIRDKWRELCILEPEVIEKYRPELEKLSINITVIDKNTDTCGYENDYLIELLRSAGIPANRIEMPGGHNQFLNERFIELAKAVLSGLNIVSVEPKGKLSIAWGKIKSQR
jgi:pimeloyl-ACP methyl ester carboxylesterase